MEESSLAEPQTQKQDADPQLPIDRIISGAIQEETDYIRYMSDPGNALYKALEANYPELRLASIDLRQQTIEALKTLDPNTATFEDVQRISEEFKNKRDKLEREAYGKDYV